MAGCEACSAREPVKCGSGAFPGGVCIGLPLIFYPGGGRLHPGALKFFCFSAVEHLRSELKYSAAAPPCRYRLRSVTPGQLSLRKGMAGRPSRL